MFSYPMPAHRGSPQGPFTYRTDREALSRFLPQRFDITEAVIERATR